MKTKPNKDFPYIIFPFYTILPLPLTLHIFLCYIDNFRHTFRILAAAKYMYITTAGSWLIIEW